MGTRKRSFHVHGLLLCCCSCTFTECPDFSRSSEGAKERSSSPCDRNAVLFSEGDLTLVATEQSGKIKFPPLHLSSYSIPPVFLPFSVNPSFPPVPISPVCSFSPATLITLLSITPLYLQAFSLWTSLLEGPFRNHAFSEHKNLIDKNRYSLGGERGGLNIDVDKSAVDSPAHHTN